MLLLHCHKKTVPNPGTGVQYTKKATGNISSSCKQIQCLCEKAGTPFNPSSHRRKDSTPGQQWPLRRPNPTPSVVLQAVLAVWGTELHIQPSIPIYHSFCSPPQGQLQFKCHAGYLFCISLFVQYLNRQCIFRLLVTDAFLSGLCHILQQPRFSLEDSFLPEFPPHTKSFIKCNLFQRCTSC